MAKKEVKTDLWIARQLDDSKIKYDAQGSDVKEINDALQSASKRGTGNAGYPEYVAVVKDFVIVIEDKADLAKHQKLTSTGILSVDQKDIADYAVNGAYFYAKHIAQNSSFHKIFAIGVSGDEKHHRITPLYVDDRDGYKQLPDIESFTSFTAVNIDEYYTRYVLAEKTDVEKTAEEILKDAAETPLVRRCGVRRLDGFAHAHNEKPCPVTIYKGYRYEGVQRGSTQFCAISFLKSSQRNLQMLLKCVLGCGIIL